MLQGDSPFACAYREHTSAYPHTELGIDLKLMTQQPGRLPLGRYLCGTITRDAEDHYLFVEHVDHFLTEEEIEEYLKEHGEE